MSDSIQWYTKQQVDNLLAGVGGGSVAWADITGKPANYPPAAHDHAAADITDATTVGKAVLTAADAATARTAIGAGTSDLAIGTTAGTAAAGNDPRLSDARTPTAHKGSHASGGSDALTPADIGAAVSGHSHAPPAAADISDSTATGRAVLTAADAATARSAIGAGTSNLAIGTTSTTAAAGNRAASTTAIGMVELATNTEATTGTDTTRAVTPAGVKAVVDALSIPDSPDDIGAAPATQAIDVKTAPYTLVATDAGKTIVMDLSAPGVLTVPANVFAAGQYVEFIDVGTARVTFVADTGMTLNGTPSLISRDQFSMHAVRFRSATSAVVGGDLA